MKYEKEGNCIRFLDTEDIPYSTWLVLLARINHLGYDLPGVDSLKAYFDRHCLLNEDQSIEVLKVFGENHEEKTYTEEQIREYNNKAIAHFGTTTRLSLAGYVLTDGTLLKMACDEYGVRDIDHREIKDVLDVDCQDDASAAMITFINFGNIRLQISGFEISKPLTEKQKPAIAAMIRKARNDPSGDTSLFVDIANYTGQVVKTFNYDFPSIPQVFSDIEEYFKSIEIPPIETMMR